MNDQEFEFEKQRVADALARWREDMGLGAWWIHPTYFREARNATRSTSDTCVMSVDARWPLKTAYLEVYLPQTEIMDDDRIEWSVVHELCHILTAEIVGQTGDEETPQERDHIERVVSDMATAFIFVRNAALARGREREIERIVKQATAEDVEQWPLLSVVNGGMGQSDEQPE